MCSTHKLADLKEDFTSPQPCLSFSHVTKSLLSSTLRLINIAEEQKKKKGAGGGERTIKFNMPWMKSWSSSLLTGLSSPELRVPFYVLPRNFFHISPLHVTSQKLLCFSNFSQARPTLAFSALWKHTGRYMVNYTELEGVPNFLACIGRALLQYILNTQKISIFIQKK